MPSEQKERNGPPGSLAPPVRAGGIWARMRRLIVADAIDAWFLLLLILAVFWYHHDTRYWSGVVTVGEQQYGDAEFWWSGAIQFANGVLRDNINLTYRMGYAIIAGLWVAVFGSNFATFHVYLLVLFVATWFALYRTLRPSLGAFLAAIGVLLIALNPFTAEWLAVSTSDSLGLLLNTWSLILLIRGLRNGLNAPCLAGSGVFVALSSLTRPLMTPFGILASLLPFCAANASWRRRARMAATFFAAFLVPMLIWMAVLRNYTGNWKMAGSDAATFYAASDPQIQSWTPSMLPRVERLATERFHVTNPLDLTQSQKDAVFWSLTRENYGRFLSYHAERILPSVAAVAAMSIQKAAHVDVGSWAIRLLLVVILAVALHLRLLRKGEGLRSILVIILSVAWILSYSTEWVVMLAAGASFLYWRRRLDWAPVVLAVYWITGAGALYLIGGTYGPPLGPSTAINALGYRLGAQFFFVSDLMVLFLVAAICAFHEKPAGQEVQLQAFLLPKNWAMPRARLSGAISVLSLVVAGAVAAELAAGASLVTYRAVHRSGATQRYPELMPVEQMIRPKLAALSPAVRLQRITTELEVGLHRDEASSYLLATGSTAGFTWRLDGQDRTKLLLVLQDYVYPFDYRRRLFVDTAATLDAASWRHREGAWLLRRFKDEPLLSNLPWYISDVAVRAWIPLNEQRTGYDLTKGLWFLLAKYASQLHIDGELAAEHAGLEFSGTSGTLRYPRRFCLRPNAEDGAVAALVVHAERALGRRTLKFAVQYDANAAGESPVAPAIRILRMSPQGSPAITSAEETIQLAPAAVGTELREVTLDLNSPPTASVRIEFLGALAGSPIWIYELNVFADDWQ